MIATFPTGCTGGAPHLTKACTPPATTGAILLTNSAPLAIQEVYLAPLGATAWGIKVNASAVAPGATFSITSVPPGTYNGMIIANDGVSPYYAYSNAVSVVAGQTLYVSVSAADFTGSVTVTNRNTAYALTQLYIVPNGAASWGTNLLQSAIYSNFYFLFWGVVPGLYDVRCVHSNGGVSEGYAYPVSPLGRFDVTCY